MFDDKASMESKGSRKREMREKKLLPENIRLIHFVFVFIVFMHMLNLQDEVVKGIILIYKTKNNQP